VESLLELQTKIEKCKRLIAVENQRHAETIEKLTDTMKELEKAVEDWGTANASYRII